MDSKYANTITLNNASEASVNISHAYTLSNDVRPLGPLMDSGGPYSAIGAVELATLSCDLIPDWNGSLHPLPSS